MNLYSNNEPFLDDRIFNFAKLARESLSNAKIVLSTNGTLVDYDKYLRIIDNLDELYINDYRDDLKLSPHLQELQNRIETHMKYNNKTFIQIRYNNEILTTRGGLAPNARRRKALDIGCARPSDQMIVRPDGKLSLCCCDPLGTVTLGDLNETDILAAWNSEKAKDIRYKVMQSREHFDICKGCNAI